MKRIFPIIVMFAVMSNTATGWKRRGHHDFHHHHHDWNMEGNGHFPPHHGAHDWDDSNKHSRDWGHHQHPPCHHRPHQDWGGNHGNWDGNKGHWGGNNGNWGGSNGNWGGDNDNMGGNNGNWGGDNDNLGGNSGNWGSNNADQGGNNGNWGSNNADQGGNNGNWGSNNADQGGNNGNWGSNNADQGGNNGNWGSNNADQGGNNGNWGSNNADQGGNNSNWVDNNPGQVSNNGDSDGIKDDGGNQIIDGHWPIIQRSTPSTPITQANPTADYPVPTEQFTIPTEQLPVPTEQLANPAEQFPNPTLSSSSSTFLPVPPPESTSPVSQNIDDCERSCLVTSEYDPVCGTNYRTYNNMGRFLCAQACGVDVRLFLRRACPSLNVPTTARSNVPNGLTGVGAVTYAAIQCIMFCNFTEEDSPVCGSDDITYDNPSMLLCAQTCGYNVTIKIMSACSDVNGDTLRNEVQTTPIPYAVRSCINSCSSSSEYNPVCGTNGVTYQNPGQLNCAALCGIDVEILKRSPCSTSTNNNGNSNGNNLNSNSNFNSNNDFNSNSNFNSNNNFNNTNNFNSNNPVTTTTTTPVVVPSRAQLETCMRSCPQTQEYNPVCGTNGVTYNNPGHLSCAQACGVSVQLRRNSVCPRPVATQSPASDFLPVSPVTNQQLPITPSTTTTIEFDMIDKNGPVNGADIINIPPTQAPNVSNENPQANDSASTIPSELILSIFTQPAPATTPEPDEEFDIDPRYGEDKRE